LSLGGAAGVADGNPATAHAQLESDQASAELGTSVSGAGHVNGDGDSRLVLARQQRADGSSQPVQPWGRSWDDNTFEVRMQATHPEGRGCFTGTWGPKCKPPGLLRRPGDSFRW
jgi:hypothetical protein